MKKIVIILLILLISIIGIILFIYKDQSVAILGYHSFIESDKKSFCNRKWGHRDLNPDPGISLASVLQLFITTDTVQLRVYFFKDNWSPR